MYMNKIRIPKWGTIIGGIVAVCSIILQYVPAIANAVPEVGHNHMVNVVIGVAGAIIASYGTPPHANTPYGGVQLPTEPPVVTTPTTVPGQNG